MTDVARCQEAITNYVLDAGEAVSYRALASQIGGGASSAVRAQALAEFCEANVTTGGVGAVRVSIVKGSAGSKSVDPRARVIRISTVATSAPQANDVDSSIYGVFPSASAGKDNDANVHEAMTLALWAQERKLRNEMFAGRARHAPLSRELQAFYESDVHCTEATSRANMMAGSRGEEAVSVFESIKATTVGRSQPTAASKSSFFKSSTTTSTTATAASSSSKGGSSSSSSSFFKSSGNGTTASTKAKPLAAVTTTKSSASETKRIDAKAMNNVLSVDSDSDEDDEDGGAPKFVKTAPATKARAAKRVMISDDEDDDDFEMVDAPPPAKKETPRPSAKRKLSDSPEPAAKQAKTQSSPPKSESPNRKRDEIDETVNEEPQPEEEEALPSGPIKRRELVTKTRINDDGYMVTEKTYEEVEVTVEQLAKERAEAKKKQAAAKAAADAQKARAAAATAAANNSKSAKSTGPAKQKKLDFFFSRK